MRTALPVELQWGDILQESQGESLRAQGDDHLGSLKMSSWGVLLVGFGVIIPRAQEITEGQGG